MIGHVAIQCRTNTGKLGSFLFTANEKPNTNAPLSPIFPDCAALFAWLKAEGWNATPWYSGRCPTGEYQKE